MEAVEAPELALDRQDFHPIEARLAGVLAKRVLPHHRTRSNRGRIGNAGGQAEEHAPAVEQPIFKASGGFESVLRPLVHDDDRAAVAHQSPHGLQRLDRPTHVVDAFKGNR